MPHRPIDELPDKAEVTIQSNQHGFWIRDKESVDYQPPGWLDGLIRNCWENGYAQAQRDMRQVLGLEGSEKEECECQAAEAATNVEVQSGGA